MVSGVTEDLSSLCRSWEGLSVFPGIEGLILQAAISPPSVKGAGSAQHFAGCIQSCNAKETQLKLSSPLASLVLLFLILLSFTTKFSAKRPPMKQISTRAGPSHPKAIVFSGSKMDTNINKPFKKPTTANSW